MLSFQMRMFKPVLETSINKMSQYISHVKFSYDCL